MPKFTRYRKSAPLPNDTVSVRVSQATDPDEVKLVSVDANGNQIRGGDIVVLKKNGTIRLCRNVSQALGFQRNSKGQVTLES